ncbi:hypothetical protein K402DRAFT_305037, partial [Aulographum hederae CBS 113979]
GSGPYKAYFTTDATLPRHTIYMPTSPPADLKMPVVVWGNGACFPKGTMFINMLVEWASHGIMVIANGEPEPTGGLLATGQETAQWNTQSINWITQNAGKGKYAQVDASRLGVAGQSCGGLEAYETASNPAVKSIGIFNSGALQEGQKRFPQAFKSPVAYFLGGPSDIAYNQGEADWKILPASLPRWKGNLDVGHFGTYCQRNGGSFGISGANWWRWTLRGEQQFAQYFQNGFTTEGWSAVSASLNTL